MSIIAAPTVLAAQDGLVRHDQLAALGVTRAMLRWRLGTGRWREVLPGVYASFGGYLSHRQRWIAACLYAGAGAALTGRVALRLHGVRALPGESRTPARCSRSTSCGSTARGGPTRTPG